MRRLGLKSAACWLACLLIAGCYAPDTLSAGAAGPTTVAAWSGPKSTVALSVNFGAQRHLQWIESYRATKFTAEVSGAGIPGWLMLASSDATTARFGPAGSDGTRTATLDAQVPAGDRRVFRIRIYDTGPQPNVLLDELWGVADVPANTTLQQTYPVTVTPMTTPTARIFATLIQTNAAKALTLPIANVQHYVEQLLNTNWVTGAALDPSEPQVSYAVLDINQAAQAIIRGNNGIPFQIPVPIPASLLVPDANNPLESALASSMKVSGQVHARALDLHGNVVARPLAFYLTDPTSAEETASGTSPAERTFNPVPPGSWDFVVKDLDRGTATYKPISVTAGQTAEAFAVLPPATLKIAGDYDAEADTNGAYNGEDEPALMAYMSDPAALYVSNGQLTYVDAGNYRVRRFALNTPPNLVDTVAGNGRNGHQGDGGPATSAWLALDDRCGVAVDASGTTYVAENDNTLRAIAPNGTIANFWAPTPWYSYYRMTQVTYDPATNALYVGFLNSAALYKLDLNVYSPSNPSAGVSKINVPYGGLYAPDGVAISGDYLFTITGGFQQPAQIARYQISTGQVATIVGKTPTGPAGDDTPAANLNESNLFGLCVDREGNLFFSGTAGLYRVMNATSGTATSNNWTVKLVLPDGGLGHVAIDPVTDQLYAVTHVNHVDQRGQNQAVPVIEQIMP